MIHRNHMFENTYLIGPLEMADFILRIGLKVIEFETNTTFKLRILFEDGCVWLEIFYNWIVLKKPRTVLCVNHFWRVRPLLKLVDSINETLERESCICSNCILYNLNFDFFWICIYIHPYTLVFLIYFFNMFL